MKALAERAHRLLLAKALGEFTHERLLQPQPCGQQWEVTTPEATYCFAATVLPLEHWVVDPGSITRTPDWPDGPCVLTLVKDLAPHLGLRDAALAAYLQELSSTWAARVVTLGAARPTSQELLAASTLQVEAAMGEGHPAFVATNGRLGFTATDYQRYAPECATPQRVQWVAARRQHLQLSLTDDVTQADLEQQVWAPGELDRLHAQLRHHGYDPADYRLFPVHPWQWERHGASTFGPCVAAGRLVPLALSVDTYLPQQSVRTWAAASRRDAPYLKMALGITNMGFVRGLSPTYMAATPAITQWVTSRLAEDPVLMRHGCQLLREYAAWGYTGSPYHGADPHSDQAKYLAALVRERPQPQPGERLVTMAALLHRDARGASMLTALIAASGVTAQAWVAALVDAYVVPVLYLQEQHRLVFMPHTENVILRLRDHRPTGMYLKDIGEEVGYLGDDSLPPPVERIRLRLDHDVAALSFFTDVMDGVLRFLSGILHVDATLSATDFWDVVAERLTAYRVRCPQPTHRDDWFTPTFAHSCLNRLQLRNPTAMVDLTDQASSLIMAGTLENPLRGATS